MGARGPKPKPNALKVLNGARPSRVSGDAPNPPPARPEPPGHLAGEALAEWHRVVPLVESMRVLTPADGPALGIYCVAYDRWLRARAEIERVGLFVDTTVIESEAEDGSPTETVNPKGCIKSNPAVAVAAACEATMAKILGAFGMTPSDRTRVRPSEAAETRSKLDKFRVKA